MKVFELLIPLTCGLYLTYLVHTMSQIEDDEEADNSINSLKARSFGLNSQL